MSAPPVDDVPDRDGLQRREPAARAAPQVLGAVIRRFGDFAAAEDAVQEALLAAAHAMARRGACPTTRADG